MDTQNEIKASDMLRPFHFVGPEHPFHPQIAAFQEALDASSLYEKACALAASSGRKDGLKKWTVHCEIKGRLIEETDWELNRFYWSFQYWDPSLPLGFHAITLYYAAKTGKTFFYQFPDDPYLSGMADYFHQLKAGGGAMHVLRYVPLRRFTFLLSGHEAHPESVIAKFKRKSRFREGFDRIRLVYEGSQAQKIPFSLPVPISLDKGHCLYFQEKKKGEDLALLLSEANYQGLLRRVGQLHAALHDMKVDAAPSWDFSDVIQTLKNDISWIKFFMPEDTAFLKEVLTQLLERIPDCAPEDQVFCHGDFVCSQLLKSGEDWAVIDFDLVKSADRYFEMAMLIASLRYDVPLFEAAAASGNLSMLSEAEEAYLEGYDRHFHKPLDRERLTWYRMRFEIYYLALMIKKDRFHPAAYQYGINQLYRLRDDLLREIP